MKARILYVCLKILLTFCLASCSRTPEELEHIDFEDTVELKERKGSQDTEINICVGSMITPEEGYAYYKRLLDYIEKKLDLEVNFIEKRTYAEVNELLKNGGVDVAFVCGGPYVKGHDEFGLELLAAPVVNGKTVYYSYIITAKDSGIENLKGLRGKVFAFVDPLSNTGKLIPTYMLYKLNETPKDFFKASLYTYSHDNSIRAVAHGIVDGAAVDSLIWEYMNKKNDKYAKRTKVIKVSGPYGIPPVVARPGLEDGLKTKIKNILLNIHRDKEGMGIIEGMAIERFVEVDDSIYDSIRRLRARVVE